MSLGFLGNKANISGAPVSARDALTGEFVAATSALLSEKGYRVNQTDQEPLVVVRPLMTDRWGLAVSLHVKEWDNTSAVIKRTDPMAGLFKMREDMAGMFMRVEARLKPVPGKTGFAIEFKPDKLRLHYQSLATKEFSELRDVRTQMQRIAQLAENFEQNLK